MTKRLVGVVIVVGAIVALLAFGFGKDPSFIPSPLINRSAPAFTLKRLDDGRSLSLARYRGRVVLVNFWASWCAACKAEHPYLLRAWRTYHAKGMTLIGVLYEDSPQAARSFMRQRGGGWPVVLDPGQETAINYGVYGIPETFFLDRKGVIRYKSIGPVTPSVLTREISLLLRPPARHRLQSYPPKSRQRAAMAGSGQPGRGRLARGREAYPGSAAIRLHWDRSIHQTVR